MVVREEEREGQQKVRRTKATAQRGGGEETNLLVDLSDVVLELLLGLRSGHLEDRARRPDDKQSALVPAHSPLPQEVFSSASARRTTTSAPWIPPSSQGAKETRSYLVDCLRV